MGSGVMSRMIGCVGVGDGMIINAVAVGVGDGGVDVGNAGIEVAVGVVTEVAHALKLSDRINRMNK